MLANEFDRAVFLSYMVACHVRSLRRGTNENAAMNGLLSLALHPALVRLDVTSTLVSVGPRWYPDV